MSTQTPAHSSYDVVIIGGAIMGASAAWFLSDDADFDGRVLVVDRDLTYENTSTMHTNSCMRQQFSGELNVRISQFAADFVKNLRGYMGGDARVPNLGIRAFGYMYLADNAGFADVLRESQQVQLAAGTATKLMTPEQIKAGYPFASGPRAARTAQMAGITVPVEPRKRYSWIFAAENPLDRDLPLTIDPSGVHVRENGGGTYQCGGHAEIAPAIPGHGAGHRRNHGAWGLQITRYVAVSF